MKNHHARVVVQSWVCLNESLHVQYHDDQNLENIYKITVTGIWLNQKFWSKIEKSSNFDSKTSFGSNSNYGPNPNFFPNSNFELKIEIWFEKNENFGPKLKKIEFWPKNRILVKESIFDSSKNGRKLKKNLHCCWRILFWAVARATASFCLCISSICFLRSSFSLIASVFWINSLSFF